MSSGNTVQQGSGEPAATNTGLSNAFLSNQAMPQTYRPAPSTFAQLSGTGSLPGLTGSLIGNNSMPALPRPTGPMPLPPPVVPAASPTPLNQNAHQLWGGFNVRSDGTSSFGGTPGKVTGGTKLTEEQERIKKLMGGPMVFGGR